MSDDKVVILEKKDFDEIIGLSRILVKSWNLTLDESAVKREKVGKAILYRCRGVIVNTEDLEIHGSHMGKED